MNALVDEVAFRLSYAGQILRMASLQSRDETYARTLWARAEVITELAESTKQLAEGPADVRAP